MSQPLPSTSDVNVALVTLGNYRVLRVQRLLIPHGIPAGVALALGMRETGMRNICGGARWDQASGRWIATKSDRGIFQISDQFPANRAFLESVPGCPEGSWWSDPAATALEPLHCPRFSDSCDYLIEEFTTAFEFAHEHGVERQHALRFAVAAHNAGLGGAFIGYQFGDVDRETAQGDYSAWVMEVWTPIREWIHAHPGWDAKVGPAPSPW